MKTIYNCLNSLLSIRSSPDLDLKVEVGVLIVLNFHDTVKIFKILLSRVKKARQFAMNLT